MLATDRDIHEIGHVLLGLPYGSYARFILLFLQSEAVRTRSREVDERSSKGHRPDGIHVHACAAIKA